MKRKLSGREKLLGLILLVLIIISAMQLRNEKNRYINEKNLELNVNTKENEIISSNSEKDIVLIIENEIKNIVTINYINKNSYTDEYNNQCTNLQLHVSGSIDDILRIEDCLSNVGLEKSINKIEIVKNTKNIESEDAEITDNYVDCIMEIKVV